VESRILSEDELYAGKICAALDRQHPRDLFDVLMLLKYGKFSTVMRKAFIVYLISHDRPMVEVLNPGFIDIRPIYETEFQGMTSEEVTCENLEKTREELVSMIARELTHPEKEFIVSIKEGQPQWDLLEMEGIENPARRQMEALEYRSHESVKAQKRGWQIERLPGSIDLHDGFIAFLRIAITERFWVVISTARRNLAFSPNGSRLLTGRAREG
jgi:hypothetical protein